MPNIKPISDLRNYNEVLKDVAAGAPVFLTKNGRGRFAVLDIEEYEQNKATLQLLAALARGRKAGEEQGWLSMSELEGSLEEDDG